MDTRRTTNSANNQGIVENTNAPAESAIGAIDLFGNVATSLVSELLGSRPVIFIPQGSRVKAFVNRDLIFPRGTVGSVRKY